MSPDMTPPDSKAEMPLSADARRSLLDMGDLLERHPDLLDGFVQTVIELKMQEALVLVEKQLDYGPGNIANPPAGISPETALLVRINDKLNRLGNMLATGLDARNEAVEDSWLDVANYGTIGMMVRTGVWPSA